MDIMQLLAALQGSRPAASPMAPPVMAGRGPLAPAAAMPMGAPAPAAVAPRRGPLAGMDVVGSQAAPAAAMQVAPIVPDVRSAPLEARGNIFDRAIGRVGDFVESDQGRGALFRAGATMLGTGNVGQGFMAGAGYVDQQKAAAAAQAEKDRQFGLDERGVDINQQEADSTALYRAGQLENAGQQTMLDAMELQEAVRKNQAGEALTASQQAVLERNNIRQTQASIDNNVRTNQTSQQNNIRTTSTTARGQDIASADRQRGQNLGFYEPQSGGAATTYTLDENGNRIGSTTTQARPAAPVLIRSQADYDALAPGQAYMDETGVPGVKR